MLNRLSSELLKRIGVIRAGYNIDSLVRRFELSRDILLDEIERRINTLILYTRVGSSGITLTSSRKIV